RPPRRRCGSETMCAGRAARAGRRRSASSWTPLLLDEMAPCALSRRHLGAGGLVSAATVEHEGAARVEAAAGRPQSRPWHGALDLLQLAPPRLGLGNGFQQP